MENVYALHASPQGWMTMMVAPLDSLKPESIEDVIRPGGALTVAPWYPLSRVQSAIVYSDADSRRMVALDAHDAGPKALSALPQPFRLGLAWRNSKLELVHMNWWLRAEIKENKSTMHGPELLISVAPDQPNRLTGDVKELIR